MKMVTCVNGKRDQNVKQIKKRSRTIPGIQFKEFSLTSLIIVLERTISKSENLFVKIRSKIFKKKPEKHQNAALEQKSLERNGNLV